MRWVLALLAAASAVPTSANVVLDLSKEFEVGNIQNPDQELFEGRLGRDIRRMLVLEHGEIVMEYERDNVKDGEIYNLFSATKTIMGAIMGVLIESDDYNLTLATTLGDVFPEEYAWSGTDNATEIDCKQTVDMLGLLTMTSGLSSGSDLNPFTEGFLNPFDIPNSMGSDLPESLSIPDCYPELKGNFWYMENSNVLSYVIKQVTGLSPKEFADAHFFPALGINSTDWDWDANSEGVATSFSQMRLTARQMAKVAQLFLQKGYSAPGQSLLSEEWVDASLSKFIWAEMFGNSFGYLWHVYDKDSIFNGGRNITTVGSVWCAAGLFGQFACLESETDRVVVLQRSNTAFDYDPNVLTVLVVDAFSTNYSFTAPPTISPAPTGAPSSGAASHSTPTFLMAAVTALVVATF